jgi:hypothetical protein
MVAIIVTGFALTLDKSLPYRISSSHYTQYLWANRLANVSFVISIVVILFCVAVRRWRPFLFGFVSLAALILFIGGMHSGPIPDIWCQNNLRSIDGAKGQLALEIALTNGAVATEEQISKYIDAGFKSLRCAEGGRYFIGFIGAEPRCSFHGSRSEIEDRRTQESRKYSGQTGAAHFIAP